MENRQPQPKHERSSSVAPKPSADREAKTKRNEKNDSENPRGPDGRPINPQKTDKPGSGQF
jgi:hypothetical protein